MKLNTVMNRLLNLEKRIQDQKKVIRKEEAKLQKISEKYKIAYDAMIEALHKEKMDNAGNSKGDIELYTSDHYYIENGPKFYTYVHKHKAFDLLSKKLLKSAVEDRLKDTKKIPGIGIFSNEKLKVTLYDD